MSFLQDYLEYNEGNECPELYHYWTALTLLAAATGNRVRIDNGYHIIYANLYVALIGKQGNRKSSAKDIGRDLFQKAFPDYPIGASVQSCNDIIKRMSADDAERSYVNEEETSVSWRPMVFFINELKNFLSINPSQMIDFLTDIYDRNGRIFDSSTIKHGLQNIENPCVNLLACETPEWITERLKYQIISGGFSRRMNYVYITEEGPRIPFPMPTQAGREALVRCLEHLKRVPNFKGQFKWTTDAKEFYSSWYKSIKAPDDPFLAGYYRSKHIQLLKVSMLLALAETQPLLVLTKELLELALAILDKTEINLARLSLAAGRNELAVPQQNLIELLENNDGWMLEKDLLRKLDKDLGPMEKIQVMRNLTDTQRIVKKIVRLPIGVNEDKVCILIYERWAKYEVDKLKSGK